MTQLPSFNALNTFVVAARCLNFTRAAAELGVTQTAVSHQVKALEAYLQAQLFNRVNNALTLTEKGSVYYDALRGAFNTITSATEAVVDHKTERTLALAVTQTFATRWLIPRLSKFHSRHPEITVKLFSADLPFDFANDSFDAAIRPGVKWPSFRCIKVLPIIIFPVCSPGLLSRSQALHQPRDLANHTIVRVAKSPDDWQIWLKSIGLEELRGRHEIVVDNFSYAWQLTREGIGITIGRFPLIEEDLESGELVSPFPDCAVKRRAWYHLIWPKVGTGEREVRLFRRWLATETADMQAGMELRMSSYPALLDGIA